MSAARTKAIGPGVLDGGDRVLVVRGQAVGGVPPKKYRARVKSTFRAGAQVVIDDPAFSGSRRETTVPFGQLEWDPASAPKKVAADAPILRVAEESRPTYATLAAVPPPEPEPVRPPVHGAPRFTPPAGVEPPPQQRRPDELDAWLAMGRELAAAAEARFTAAAARVEEIDGLVHALEVERRDAERERDEASALLAKIRKL